MFRSIMVCGFAKSNSHLFLCYHVKNKQTQIILGLHCNYAIFSLEIMLKQVGLPQKVPKKRNKPTPFYIWNRFVNLGCFELNDTNKMCLKTEKFLIINRHIRKYLSRQRTVPCPQEVCSVEFTNFFACFQNQIRRYRKLIKSPFNKFWDKCAVCSRFTAHTNRYTGIFSTFDCHFNGF